MALAEVKVLYDSSLHDVPAKLRLLADDIDSGKYGEVGSCAVAILADKLEIFGFGLDSDGPSIHYLLSCATRKIEQMALDHGN